MGKKINNMFIEIEGQLLNLDNVISIYKYDDYQPKREFSYHYHICIRGIDGVVKIIYESLQSNKRDEFYNKLKTQLIEIK